MSAIPTEFLLFGATLAGVALFHRHAFGVALAGAAAVTTFKVLVSGFAGVAGLHGFVDHLGHEWVVLVNLGLLLTGFALLARHFEHSGIPEVLPRFLPEGRAGAFVLLALVFVLSSFLDNIAAAMIGGALALVLFPRVHVGYIAGIVAASNAGGAGSVIGDTTTTMMWIDGVSPLDVVHAGVAAIVALFVSGFIASGQQHRLAPLGRPSSTAAPIDWARVGVVGALLGVSVAVNVFVNVRHPEVADQWPFLGLALWTTLLVTAPVRRPDWQALPSAATGAVFLLSLVLAASMMPVESLPAASWQTAFGLGFVSAVFDNIPLTALALNQGGYDWGVLAFAVGYGGSMLWFGSSAGVAISNLFPQARSAGGWLRNGWHVALGYVVGFAALLLILGWSPHPPHR